MNNFSEKSKFNIYSTEFNIFSISEKIYEYYNSYFQINSLFSFTNKNLFKIEFFKLIKNLSFLFSSLSFKKLK